METASVPMLLEELERMADAYANQSLRNHDLAEMVLGLTRVCRLQNAQIAELWALVSAAPRGHYDHRLGRFVLDE